MESTLRALRKEQLVLTAEVMDALIAGTKVLEEVIAARRAEHPPPDIAPVMTQLEAIAPEAPSLSPSTPPPPAAPAPPAPTPAAIPTSLDLNEKESARLAAELEAGAQAWQFEFVPALELAERGISVDSIRTRLQEIGELIRAAPRVTAEGGIAFEFLVASHADETAFASWQDDGLTWTPYEPSPPPSAPATGTGEEPLTLTTKVMDALRTGLKVLEQVIVVRRIEQPAPDIAPVVEQCEAAALDTTPSTPPSPAITPAAISTQLDLDWEGVREGVDDLRYIYTLEQAIEAAEGDPARAEAVAAAHALLDSLQADLNRYGPEARGIIAYFEPQDYRRYRWEMAQAILMFKQRIYLPLVMK